MAKTIFEKIVDREAQADILYEDDHILAFRDLAPRLGSALLESSAQSALLTAAHGSRPNSVEHAPELAHFLKLAQQTVAWDGPT